MSWFSQTCSSSLGKKYIMALTGLMLGTFLLVHAAGNSSIFWGRETFLSYARHLHSLGPLIPVAELILLSVFLLHVTTGITLFLNNRQARTERYAVDKTAGGRTWGSRTMPYTGAAVLIFITLHLFNVRFVNPNIPIADVVNTVLSNPLYSLFYATGITLLALHISHGFWSLFQSIGLNHPRYNGCIRVSAYLTCAVIISIFLIILVRLISNARYLA
jgi:succinate dehydrogenase / fumarate reductase cytochrome b subunit